ncbi:MAG: Coenzyme F420 hydrogenase/dehydrogenase, beta subunit C-terminal domain [Deltaproteobacteria bacterium]|nr:Coenzyme F420 hydrogenase/dehydrogenase, beta subunit C-terminal domain [Deltaproteobacteria bacterium]
MDDQEQSLGQKELREGVLDAHLCVGCGACAYLCPYQVIYKDQTIILHDCDLKQGRCYAFCPRTPTDYDAARRRLFDEKDLTPELGPVKGFYIARAKSKADRKKAQHGGTVSALMALALEEGIIDTAVVAEGEADFLHHSVAVNDPKEVKKRGKSKFIVSPTVAQFNKAAAGEAQKIGVVATPCQAQAFAKMRMKPIAGKESNIDKLQLVIGLFCGWALNWRSFTELLSRSTPLKTITGMDKPPGTQTVEIFTKSGTISLSVDDIDKCVREACRYCIDSTAEFADISVGSARLPESWDETKTWNQVIVRSESGQRLMERARAKGILEFHDVPEGNFAELKKAAVEKKKGALGQIIKKSGDSNNLIYLDRNDPVVKAMMG